MKFQILFSMKNKKNISLSSSEFGHSMVSVSQSLRQAGTTSNP